MVVVVMVMCKRVWHGWSISRAWQTQQVGQILPALLHAHCSHKWHPALEYITWVTLLQYYQTLHRTEPYGFKSSTPYKKSQVSIYNIQYPLQWHLDFMFPEPMFSLTQHIFLSVQPKPPLEQWHTFLKYICLCFLTKSSIICSKWA